MKHLLVLVAGSFGAAVAAALGRSRAVRIAPLDHAALDPLLDGASFVAVASWRRDLEASERVDAACARAHVAWSQAFLDGPELISGPVVVPGGPCFACYRRRWLTHVEMLDRERALDAAYAADSSCGPKGWLPGLADAAAAGLLADCDDGSQAAGRVRWFDALSGHVGETRVIPVWRCQRCGTASGPERYVEHIVAALAQELP